MKQNKIIVLIYGLSLILFFTVQCCSKDSPSEATPPVITDPDPKPTPDSQGELLYNGIRLPLSWPPNRSYVSDLEKGMNPYYLNAKPDTIDISIGRQLFVDNFLISETTLNRSFHYPIYHSSPILKPDKDWENLGIGGDKFAAPFSDGVWFDETDNKFKMWYMAGGGSISPDGKAAVCYAESINGINWDKPVLSYVNGTNIVYKGDLRDSNVVWLDKQEVNASRRYKMFPVLRGNDDVWRYHYFYSADGVSWMSANAMSQPIADRSTVYKNEFRNNWVYSMRHGVRVNPEKKVRARDYYENADPVQGTREAEALLSAFWFGPWQNETRNPDYPEIDPQIYNHDAISYESITLGFFSVWEGPENDVANAIGRPKRNEIMVGYSRDGYSWLRQDMKPFHPVSENQADWNWGNIQSAAGVPIIVGDKLYFYMSGRTEVNNNEITSTGLATLRRDGFVSMAAAGTELSLTTELLKFSGKFFFVNAEDAQNLKVELLDKDGNILSGFEKENCNAFTGNSTKKQITWTGKNDISSLQNQAIKVRFYITSGNLYSFWISPWASGESNGFTAGGGLGMHPSGKDIPL